MDVYLIEKYVNSVDVYFPTQSLEEVYVVFGQLIGHRAKLGQFHW